MHDPRTVDAALALSATGMTPTEIGRRLGVPKSTVQYWCRRGRSGEGPGAPERVCARCHGNELDLSQYAYLLGCYLGDGHLTVGRRTTVLWIYCSDDWPGVRREVQDAVEAVMPARGVSVSARTGCCAVKSFTQHWRCLFPQHGPGRKHTRRIVLAPWQQDIVDRHPGRLLRGLFHSDGCRVVNWARQRTSDGVRRYEYPRYLFSNKSDDILGICEMALDQLGIAHRRSRWDTVSVAKRAAVASLDGHVGPKY